ncbi:AraC family transcriptional regulator [Pseudomonas siliginis]|uniref:AraC family transcriptional regulator n=1 Tax=Pseudomonas siliginis TaxID=2842346 RepID=UPI001C3CDA24|nr:AraC family transcriptional regulator [Pseudomonas siliginis]MBV4469132.1 AraC family transcriptional regulator [Pseudomonas siliginis]
MPHLHTSAERCKLPRVFWESIAQLGLDPSLIEQHAELPHDLYLNESTFVSTQQLFAVWNAIEALSADPALAIKMVRDTPSAKHKMAFITALYAADYRDGLARLARLQRLCSPDKLSMVEHQNTVSFTIQWPSGTGPAPYLSVEACFALVLELGRRGTGKHITPMSLSLRRPKPPLETHSDYFACPINYGASHDEMIVSASDLERPFLHHNAQVLHMMSPGLDAALRAIEAPVGFCEQVIEIFKRTLANGRPSLQHLARELLQSERTLQRRLASEGTTFNALLNEARRQVGLHLLADKSLELKEVAYLLGYDDVNSYYRAFRQVEKVTPSQWRRSFNT